MNKLIIVLSFLALTPLQGFSQLSSLWKASQPEQRSLQYQVRQADRELVISVKRDRTLSPIQKREKLNQLLIKSLRQGNLPRAWLLIRAGADPNAKDKRNVTVLMRTVLTGNLELVQFLIGKGADVNARNQNDMSVLRYATRLTRRTPEIVDLLRKHGARE